MSVAVIIPAFNQRTYIEEAIESVLSQSWPVEEVVVVDDGSTDGDYRELEQIDPRIRVLRTGRGGVSRARNFGAAMVKADYLAFLDADDRWLPGLLERQMRHLHKHPEARAVFSECIWWYPEGGEEAPRPSWRLPPGAHRIPTWCPTRRLSHLEILSRPGLPGHMCTLLMHRADYSALGGFDEGRHYGEDIEFAIRISQALRLDLMECPGMLYRRHAKSATAQLQTPNHMADLIVDAVARFGLRDASGREVTPEVIKDVLAKSHFEHGYRHFWHGSRTVAVREFLSSLRHRHRLTAAAFLGAAILPGGRSLADLLRRSIGRASDRGPFARPAPSRTLPPPVRPPGQALPPPLRVALVVPGPECPGWLPAGITLAEASGAATPALVVIVANAGDPTAPRGGGQYFLYRLAAWYDRRRTDLPQPLAPVPLTEAAPGIPRIQVGWPVTEAAWDAITRAMREHQVDLLINGGVQALPAGIGATARLGILELHDPEGRVLGAGSMGLWQVLDDAPTTSLILRQILAGDESPRILAHSTHVTARFSFHRNHVQAAAGAPLMLVRGLERLWNDACPAARVAVEQQDPATPTCGRRADPTNRAVAVRLPRLLSLYVRERLNRRGRSLVWSLAWHWSDSDSLDSPCLEFRDFARFPFPRYPILADPFVVAASGTHWVFFEEADRPGEKGRIAVAEIGPGGPRGTPTVVLEKDWHLSFPSVFLHDGVWYLLTEASESKRVQLHAAVDFPFRWTPSHVLVDGWSMVDPLLHYHEDTWFLFCSPYGDGTRPDEELALFWAERLEGPYYPHPCNPLVTDVTCARMAGRIFTRDGKLFRPAQNCAPHYGAGIALQQIVTLSRVAYEEVTVARYAPTWDRSLIGMHTLNASGQLTVTDFLRRERV